MTTTAPVYHRGDTARPMRIWITEIGEPLPQEKDVRLLRYGVLTRFLAQRGHDVTWWASNFSHAKKAFVVPGDAEEMVEGVRLRMLAGLGYTRNISLGRFRHQAHFAARFAVEARRAERPDVILTPIPTLETSYEAVRVGAEFAVPVLIDIRDEWPDEFVRLAPRPLRWAARLALASMYRKARYVGRGATGILGISQRQLAWGLRLAGRDAGPNDQLFPLGYSPSRPDDAKVEDARVWWRGQGLRPDAFTVCFFGTIGQFFDLDTVIRAARMLEREMDVQFVLCGDGSERERFVRAADGCRAVTFPGWVDGPRIAALMEASDAGLAPYRADADVFSLPNKPFEYLAGGLPVVSSIQGELKAILERARCGLTYRGDSAEALANCVRTLHRAPDERRAMGQRGRQLIETEFSTSVIHTAIESHLLGVLGRFSTTQESRRDH